jgi:hypothetical protein
VDFGFIITISNFSAASGLPDLMGTKVWTVTTNRPVKYPALETFSDKI